MDTDATPAIPAEVIRYLSKRVTASSPEVRPDQRESILSGKPRLTKVRADLAVRQRTVRSKRVWGTGEEKESTAARELETVTAGKVFDCIDREPGVS